MGQARWICYVRDISSLSLDVCSSCYHCVSEFEVYESVHVLSYILWTCLEIHCLGAFSNLTAESQPIENSFLLASSIIY